MATIGVSLDVDCTGSITTVSVVLSGKLSTLVDSTTYIFFILHGHLKHNIFSFRYALKYHTDTEACILKYLNNKGA